MPQARSFFIALAFAVNSSLFACGGKETPAVAPVAAPEASASAAPSADTIASAVPSAPASATSAADASVGIALPPGALGSTAPTVTVIHGALTVNGRVPPEQIQRIVRMNSGRFRLCYMNRLREKPNLTGHVSVKYVIQKDGSPGTVSDAGSDIGDDTLVQCVIRAFGNLTYPVPESGTVTVVYPLTFEPHPPPAQ